MGARLRGQHGGIAGLCRLLREHSGAVRRDLLVAGLRLEWLGTEALSWVDLRDFIIWSPRDSAINRALNPQWWVTEEISYLRLVERQLRVLAWQRTADGQATPPRNVPELIPLDEEEARAQREARGELIADVMPRDELAKRIGWDRPPPEPEPDPEPVLDHNN